MSKNIKIAGTNYNNVPSIEIPLQTSGVASFYDISDTTATASDVASGKYFYNSLGVRTVGTMSIPAEHTITTTGSVSQELVAGDLYHFTGSLTSLTITFGATTGIAQYHFDFNSGSTAPTLNMPLTVIMPDSFQVEANKHYEVDVLNNYGTVKSWSIS